MFDWFDILFIVVAICTAIGVHLVVKESNFVGNEKLILTMLAVSISAIIAMHAFYLNTSIGLMLLYDLPVGLAGIIIVYVADYFVERWKLNKFEKVLLVAFIVLIVCLSITTYMTTQKAEVGKTLTTDKTALKTSSIMNVDGSVMYNNVKPNVFNSMKQRLTAAGVQVPQGNEGDIEGFDTKIYFKWDNETNLTITIKDKPWYISNETITGKMSDFVHNYVEVNDW